MKRINWHFMLYGCNSKEEFDSVREQRTQFNYKVWRIISVICFLYFIVLFFSTYSVKTVAANAFIYATLAAIFFAASILLLKFVKPGNKFLMPLIYFISLSLLVFGIMIGTVLSPNFLAVTYHVILIGVPLMLIDKPYKIGVMEFLTAIVFIILCFLTKEGETRQLDVYNAIVFSVLAQLVNYYMVSTKMSQLLVDKKIETASLTDKLTGLRNRKAYEDDLNYYPSIPPEKDFVYVSLDVNELKIINDSLGHVAGDELLKGAGECIDACFGAYGRTYRIGGDEFAAIIFADESHLEEIKKDFENISINWSGELVDHVSISVGYATKRQYPEDTVAEIAKYADQEMYKDKSKHYKEKGVDRRGQQAAHTALLGLYTKILKIDITNDTFRIINMDTAEQTTEKGFDSTISGWFTGFGKSGQVHPDDLEGYLAKTDLNYLRDYFNQDKNLLSVFYRRKNENGYEEVVMEMIPANDYTTDVQTLFLYVKNIDKNTKNGNN